MAQKFSNNSKGTFAVVLPIEDFTTVDSADFTVTVENFAALADGDRQVATLTHIEAPGDFEIVHLLYQVDGLRLQRGMEGTTQQEWAIGATLSGRVTAGMLGGFADNVSTSALDIRPPGSDKAVALGVGADGHVPASKGFAVLTNSRFIDGAWTIAGYPVLQLRGEAISGHRIGDAATAVEAVFTSGSMQLGTVPAWAAATDYKQGAVTRPASANGYQYRLDIPVSSALGMTSGGAAPAVFATPASVSDSDRHDGGDVVDPRVDGYDDPDIGGYWTPQHLGDGVFLCIPTGYIRFYPTEIGFICDEYTASTSPVVTIGSAILYDGETVAVEDDPDLFANAVTLSGITAAHTRHRITSLPDVGVLGFVIKLDTAATGGSCHGRFYFKGMFVENLEWLPTAP